LIGYDTDSLSTTFFTVQAIQPSLYYKFKVRAGNAFGWGPFSDELSIQAATRPVAPNAVVTSILASGDVQIAWQLPYNSGATIQQVELQLLESGVWTTLQSSDRSF
jgi:hypothetical protein